MFRRFAFPFYDVADAGGAGAVADVADVADLSGDDGESSLADHEASYGRGATREPAAVAEPEAEPAADTRERDETGKFKPRHRAKSQQASAEDVPRIQELTRLRREAETRAEAAERRAEEAERRAAERREPAREPARETPKPAAQRFPTWEEWQTIPGHESDDWYAYDDAKADWRYETRRAAEKAEEDARAADRDWQDTRSAFSAKIPDVLKVHADYHEVVTGERAQTSKVVERAVLEIGPEAAYFLATHDDERRGLTDDTLYVDPKQSAAFKAAVATTKRYLSTLVASEQRRSAPPSRTAAAPSGSALALVAPTPPKPPNPLRTSALRDPDALPGDESSLADHERAYSPKRRRG